jgi:hypothetical protein
MRSSAPLALALLLLSGCSGYRRDLLPVLPMPRVHGRQPTPVARKIVREKQRERTTLLAHDGTWCSVGEKRYARIRVGDRVWCAWQA